MAKKVIIDEKGKLFGLINLLDLIVLISLLVLVYLGSVHLAWHYAIDAYLGWAVTLAVWYGVKPLAQWWEQRPQVIALNQQIAASPAASR